MNPLQALATLIGHSAQNVAHNVGGTINNVGRFAASQPLMHDFNLASSGPAGTSDGATPPMMVDGPNGRVPYASTIGNDKPYAGPTLPAGSPLGALPRLPYLSQFQHMQPLPRMALTPPTAGSPMYPGNPSNPLGVAGQIGAGQYPQLNQGGQFNPGNVPMQNGGNLQVPAFNSPQQQNYGPQQGLNFY